jgi:hypothetical protein
MEKTTTIVPFRQIDSVDDPLTEIAREGARRMLAEAVRAEADAFVAQYSALVLPDGRQRIVRHGHGPMRTIQTGVGPVEVQRAKVRDRADLAEAKKIRFTSLILPRWARRSKSLDALLPVLYLRGISTGDFQEVLAALLGKDAPNLSPSVIARLTAAWESEYDAWRRRDLSARRYVYIWADGVYLQARMEPTAECMLAVIGATPEGKKELVGFQVGTRESAQSWRELLVDLKARGLAIAPELAVGDGALGFWKALEEVFPSTRHQRCWVGSLNNRFSNASTGRSWDPEARSLLSPWWSGGVRLLDARETVWERGKGQNERKKSGGEPLQVDCRGGQVGLDLHVGDSTPDGACKAMPGLCLAVEPFRTPPVAPVKPLIFGGPAIPAPPSS